MLRIVSLCASLRAIIKKLLFWYHGIQRSVMREHRRIHHMGERFGEQEQAGATINHNQELLRERFITIWWRSFDDWLNGLCCPRRMQINPVIILACGRNYKRSFSSMAAIVEVDRSPWAAQAPALLQITVHLHVMGHNRLSSTSESVGILAEHG